jgi:hypothetical protein
LISLLSYLKNFGTDFGLYTTYLLRSSMQAISRYLLYIGQVKWFPKNNFFLYFQIITCFKQI